MWAVGSNPVSPPRIPTASSVCSSPGYRPAELSVQRGILVGLTAASVGLIYGYDLSSIAGALLFVTEEFGLTTRQQELLTTTVVIGQIIGALGAGVLANAIGRKKSTVLLTAGFAVFALLGASAVSLPMLLVARLLLGVAIGVAVVVVPVYVAESAPTAVRGSLLTAYQVAILSGIILGYLVGYLLAGSHSWRWILGLAAVPATLLLPLLMRLPDTARWYLLKGRADDARRALLRVEPEADVDTQLADMAGALGEGRGRVSEMLRQPYRRATVFVVTLGFLVQITGINAIIYYSPRIFAAMGFTGDFALLGLPALVQLAGLSAVFVSLFSVDRWGRRPILLSGIAMMIAADGLLVVTFSHSAGSGLIGGFGGVLLFIVGFNFGFGSLVWVYAGESFPSRLRSMGSSVMLTSTLTGNAIVAAFFLTMLHWLGGAAVFALFGALAVISFVVVLGYAPETKGRELEEIQRYWENGGHWPTEPSPAPETR
ncbi:MFS transporter [Mycobacterium kansasii]|nr:sugar porter family MFS transporter [Mycobacterium kansasii]POX73116.1 MFS transporter [Mycobacterium kansasii]POX78243.1 MFS transporter [Mycobacterium kansasii]POX79693.1 MFS transporter [Mycobacterium kansasii]POY10840.1 MFS transporter [Mycobacterium kansasii]